MSWSPCHPNLELVCLTVFSHDLTEIYALSKNWILRKREQKRLRLSSHICYYSSGFWLLKYIWNTFTDCSFVKYNVWVKCATQMWWCSKLFIKSGLLWKEPFVLLALKRSVCFFHGFFTRTLRRHRTVHVQLQSACLAGESGEDVDIRGSSCLARHYFSPSLRSSRCPLTVSVSPGRRQVESPGQLLSLTHSSLPPGWTRWQQWRCQPRHAASQESPSWGTSSRWLSADSHWVVCLHTKAAAAEEVLVTQSHVHQLHKMKNFTCQWPINIVLVWSWSLTLRNRMAEETTACSSSWAVIMMWIFIGRQCMKQWGKHCIPHPFQIVRVAPYGSAIVLLQLHDCSRCQLAVPLSISDDTFLVTLSCHLPQRCAKSLRHMVDTFFLCHWAVVSVDVEVDEMVVHLRVTVWQDCDVSEPMSLLRAMPQDLCNCSIHCTWGVMKVLIALMCLPEDSISLTTWPQDVHSMHKPTTGPFFLSTITTVKSP